MDTQLYFRPGSQETAEYLERSLGRTSEYAHSQTVRDGQTSQGISEQGVPLLTAGEIKQMGDEDIIGFHRRLPPFMAKRMDWRKFPTLTKRRSLPLPTIPVLPSLETGIWRDLAKEPPLYIDPDMVH
jgi:type IV secretory pathway TraG/TraD family ATPase VirD4